MQCELLKSEVVLAQGHNDVLKYPFAEIFKVKAHLIEHKICRKDVRKYK